MKRPSFQFYPGDWLNDASLRSVTLDARGLWMDMLCYMHQSPQYGYLMAGDKVISVDDLWRMVGAKKSHVNSLIFELKNAGVLHETVNGVYYSKRMIRDEEVRAKRADGGKKGGNPLLKEGCPKVGHKVNLRPNLRPTPSSSSSSSSSISSNEEILGASCDAKPTAPVEKNKRGTRLPQDWSPSVELIDMAKKERPDLDISRESASFRDYWHALPGQKGMKLDWDATFRNWIRRSNGFTSRPAQATRLEGKDIVPAQQRQGGSGTL